MDPENSNKGDTNYTADFILLLVTSVFPFAWSMSGFPPSIEVAVICWGIALLILLHWFWKWSFQKWHLNKLLRASVLLMVPIIVVWFSWKPIRKQYILQHSPDQPVVNSGPVWLLKLHILFVHRDPGTNPDMPNFSYRLVMDVNSQAFAFPIREPFLQPQDVFEQTVTLFGPPPYHVRFAADIYDYDRNGSKFLFVKTIHSRPDEFVVYSNQLPAKDITNEIIAPTMRLDGNRTSLGVAYDIQMQQGYK